jgi:hypothetical protein
VSGLPSVQRFVLRGKHRFFISKVGLLSWQHAQAASPLIDEQFAGALLIEQQSSDAGACVMRATALGTRSALQTARFDTSVRRSLA